MIENILGKCGYEIPCLNNITGNEKIAVIISHGLGSSKESPTVLALIEKLKSQGIGSFAYDFPGHGDSPVDGHGFHIRNCVSDLSTVESYVKKLAPQAEVMYFSSSFGAYINLIYLGRYPRLGAKTFLRSAAVDMPGIFKASETAEIVEQAKAQGYFTLSEGCLRPLEITNEFYEELDNNNVFEIYKPKTANVAMIHGDADESAPIEDAERFADYAGAELTVVKGGYHRLMEPEQLELVLEKALEFFTA